MTFSHLITRHFDSLDIFFGSWEVGICLSGPKSASCTAARTSHLVELFSRAAAASGQPGVLPILQAMICFRQMKLPEANDVAEPIVFHEEEWRFGNNFRQFV